MLSEEKRVRTKEQLREYLRIELAYYKVNALTSIFMIREEDILRRHTILLRKTEYYTNKNCNFIAIIYKIRLRRLQNKYSLHIPLNCFEKGLHIMHLGPILINEQATAGENCALHINTAIVASGINDEAPVLGNCVVVGVGAVILGGVYVADNVAIGANAVVTKNVNEQNIAVAGIPAIKISNNGRLAWNKRKEKR